MNATYDTIGHGYNTFRRAEPRLQGAILRTIGDAQRVVNVGAGTGSYEPTDRFVIAVEPSATMIRQRQQNAAPVVQASAEELPFPDSSFDAALAILTVHHWFDWRRGIQEMKRVARARVILLTYDTAATDFWLVEDYFPKIRSLDDASMPTIEELRKEFGQITVSAVPIPHDCADGFLAAYWRRPHAYLDANIRQAISVFSKLTNETEGLEKLQTDLESGRWHQKNRDLLSKDSLDLGYRLVVASL